MSENRGGIRRRWLAAALIATAVAIGTAGGVALAGGVDPTVAPPAPKTADASPAPASKGPGSGGTEPQNPQEVPEMVREALAGLVADGTIDQAQADAVLQQIEAGSVDPVALVSSGTLTAAQMQAVDQVLIGVKEAAAGAEGATGAGAGGAKAAPPIPAMAHEALAALVADGTIDQAQADAVLQQVEAGSVDPVALVSSGTLTAAQMQAVDQVLIGVKEAAAG